MFLAVPELEADSDPLVRVMDPDSWILPSLKVVGNEKVGGSQRWHMIDIGLGPW
jgi:hypothetical protein